MVYSVAEHVLRELEKQRADFRLKMTQARKCKDWDTSDYYLELCSANEMLKQYVLHNIKQFNDITLNKEVK